MTKGTIFDYRCLKHIKCNCEMFYRYDHVTLYKSSSLPLVVSHSSWTFKLTHSANSIQVGSFSNVKLKISITVHLSVTNG